MHKLHGRAGGKVRRRGASPVCQQIPGPQTQVLRRQQPQADHVARNLIGQELADAAFDADGIDFFSPILSQGSVGLQFRDWTLRMELIEFFFAARID